MYDSSSNLLIYYQNVRGLRTKTNEFYRSLCLCSYDIIVLTETWLLDSVSNSELFDVRYAIWRRDRDYNLTKQRMGGGVIIAIRKDLYVTSRPSFSSSAEDLWVTVHIKHKNSSPLNIHIGCVYMCGQNHGLSFSAQLQNFLSQFNDILLAKPSDKFIVLGDFNLSNIIWLPSNDTFLIPSNVVSNDEHLLVSELYTHNLHQFNSIKNIYGRILDLALSNDDICVLECQDPLVPIDPHHKALIITTNFVNLPNLKPQARLKFFFNKGDYESINSRIMETDWVTEFSSKSLEESIEFFYSLLDTLKQQFVPSKYISSESYPVWFTPALKKLIREKSKYLSKFKTYGNRANLDSYKLLRNRVKLLESQCYQEYLNKIENSIEKCPKQFWTFIKSRSMSGGIPNCMKYQDVVLTTGDAICNSFSKHFYSSFLSNNDSSAPPIIENSASLPICDISTINIDVDVVKKHLSQLDPSKSAGPDYVSPIFLINCASTLAVPISLLFKKSLSDGVFPNIWKSALVTPVHKKGSKSDISNYRPISKLCIIAKLFEKLVYDQVYSALHMSFIPNQHGFLKGRSTVSNLILFDDYITNAMESGGRVDVIYTDYSKCFDRIDHKLLIAKLELIGVRGDLLRWFISYIKNRSQAVVVSNYISSLVRIPSGVPQGSLLGPLLFLIFVNDISESFHYSKLLCFADDMKIFCTIKSNNDILNLQADLKRLDSYCERNKLDLNPSKCSVVTFTRRKLLIPASYALKGQLLQNKDKVKDLGVIHDSKLLFSSHIESIFAKALKALGFIMRSSRDFKRAKTFKILYCTFVRSILEYASQVWNPRYNKYIKIIESIQIKFIKYLCYKLRIPYSSDNYINICKQFHILPLTIRREIADLVYLFKLLNNKIDCPDLLNKIKINIPYKTTRFNNLLYVPLVATNYRQNSYLWRVSDSFNKVSKRLDIDLFSTSAASARLRLSREFFTNR